MDLVLVKPTLVILAAGLGSRYGSLKQIDSIGPNGELIIDYSVHDAIKAGFGKIVYVIRKSFEEEFKEVVLKNIPSSVNTSMVYQECETLQSNIVKRAKPWGTGHALISASSEIKGPFAVINADDFYGAESYKQAVNYLTNKHDSNESALIGYRLANTLSEFGHVSRGICEVDSQNYMKTVVERKEIYSSNKKIFFKTIDGNKKLLGGNETVSMNMFIFDKSIIPLFQKYFELFVHENQNNHEAEFYIPTTVNKMIENNETKVNVIDTNSEWFGLTYSEDKKQAIRKIRELISKGVYPDKLWSDR